MKKENDEAQALISMILMLCNSIITRPTGTYSIDTVIVAENIKRMIEVCNNEQSNN